MPTCLPCLIPGSIWKLVGKPVRHVCLPDHAAAQLAQEHTYFATLHRHVPVHVCKCASAILTMLIITTLLQQCRSSLATYSNMEQD
eukprot:366485-Chlamydomonas_euryale.AAC.21